MAIKHLLDTIYVIKHENGLVFGNFLPRGYFSLRIITILLAFCENISFSFILVSRFQLSAKLHTCLESGVRKVLKFDFLI